MYKGILISQAELMSRPMSGAFWNAVVTAQNTPIPAVGGTNQIGIQSSAIDAIVYGHAVYAARTGDATEKSKVANALGALIDSDLPAPNGVKDQQLFVGRDLGNVVIAADLINLPAISPATHSNFVDWLRAVRTRNYTTRRLLDSITFMGCQNHGAVTYTSLIADAIYCGDLGTAAGELEWLWTRFQGTLGDRSAYSNFGNDDINSGPYTFGYARIYCPDGQEATPRPINQAGATEVDTNGITRDVSGCWIADQAREDEARGRGTGAAMLWPPPTGLGYPTQSVHAVTVAAEMLYRAGKTNVWDLQTKAIDRMHDFLKRIWQASGGTAWYVPGSGNPTSTLSTFQRTMGALANYRYGAGRYPVYAEGSTYSQGGAPGHLSFLFQGYVGYSGTVPPPPPPPPSGEQSSFYVSSFSGPTVTGNHTPDVVIPGVPRAILVASVAPPAPDAFSPSARLSFGFAASSSDRGAFGISANPLKKIHSSSKVIQTIGADGSVYEADFVSFVDQLDGTYKPQFNWTSAPSSGRIHQILAFYGDAFTDAQSIVVTADTTTGSKVITGLGCAPSCLIALMPSKDASTTDRITHGIGIACRNASTGAIEQAFYYEQQLSGSTTPSRIQQGGAFLYNAIPDSSHAVDFLAAITSLDADGFTYNVTDATAEAAGAIPFYILALEGGSWSLNLETILGAIGSKQYAADFSPTGLFAVSFGRTPIVGVDVGKSDVSIGFSDTVRQGTLYMGGTTPFTPKGGGKRNTFETGAVDGTQVSIANSDDASAGDAVTSVTNPANVTYSTTTAAHGDLSVKINITGTSSFMVFSGLNPGGASQVYGRCYFYIPTGGSTIQLMQARNVGAGATICQFSINASRQFRVQTGGGVQIGTATGALAENTWYRVEYRITIDLALGTTGEVIGSIYQGDSTSPVGTFGGTSSALGTNPIDSMRVGITNNVTQSVYIDDVVVGASDYPGPAPDAVVGDYRARYSLSHFLQDSDAVDVLGSSVDFNNVVTNGYSLNQTTATDPAQKEFIALAVANLPQPPVNVTVPSVGGRASEGGTLIGIPGQWQGLEPITYAYQWQRSANGVTGWANIGGATALEYPINSGTDLGQYIRLREAATNSVAGPVNAFSDAVGPIVTVPVPYSPTNWINDQPPPLNPANLNKIEDELVRQAADLEFTYIRTNWTYSGPALEDPAPLNNIETALETAALLAGLTYTKTNWQSGWTPARNATNFNKIEQQLVNNRIAIG